MIFPIVPCRKAFITPVYGWLQKFILENLIKKKVLDRRYKYEVILRNLRITLDEVFKISE